MRLVRCNPNMYCLYYRDHDHDTEGEARCLGVPPHLPELSPRIEELVDCPAKGNVNTIIGGPAEQADLNKRHG